MKRSLVCVFGLALNMSSPLLLAQESAGASPAAEESSKAQDGAKQEAVCTQGKNTRKVRLDLSSDGCAVVYIKETEKPGSEDKLWQYKHEIDACKKNYSDFVEKLKGMSWSCQ